ncbi:MAG: translation initiation factor IF-2 N-terminal domain-containing protein, partial [Acidimicrobiia bacterium]
MRVYELARDLGVDSKEVLAHAGELEIDVKTASSGLSDEAAELLRLAFAPADESPAEEPVEETAGEETVVEADEEEELVVEVSEP